jgi:hypothetical protein
MFILFGGVFEQESMVVLFQSVSNCVVVVIRYQKMSVWLPATGAQPSLGTQQFTSGN